MKSHLWIYNVLLAWLLAVPAYAQTSTPAPAANSANSAAVEMTDAITPLENEQADLAINLAHSLAREKRFREALQAYQEFTRVFGHTPRLREARESMARIYERRQRYDLAIAQYETLYRELGVSPLGLAYHLEAARLFELSGDETSAVNIYKELNQLDANSEAAGRARMRMEALHLMQKSGDYVSKSGEPPQSVNSSPQNE